MTDATDTPGRLHGESLEFLRIYIRDHDGASSGGLRLAERCCDSNESTLYATQLKALVDTLHRAQDTLRQIAGRLDIKPSPIREAATWAASVLGGLKLNGRITSYSPLSRVVEFEALSAAVTAQLRLWETLKRIAPYEQRLDIGVIERFIGDCHALLDSLSSMHDAAAGEAFTAKLDQAPPAAGRSMRTATPSRT